jgi:FkbM family methyltransferase
MTERARVRLSRSALKLLYRALMTFGRPIGGVRPRRIYHALARRAFDRPEFRQSTNRWGDRLLLADYYHIDREILVTGTYDLPLHRALTRLLRSGMVCFDVGANLGEVALHMARLVGSIGQVWAFEPIPAICDRLRRHVEANGARTVRINELALSDRSGQATISCPAEDTENQGLGSLFSTGTASILLSVATTTLDEFVAAQGITRIDLMKVDIQGAEPRLVAGGRRTLERMGPDLLMEFSPGDLRHAGGSSRDLAISLADLGYHLHPLTCDDFAAELDVRSLPDNYYATNVYCTRHVVR